VLHRRDSFGSICDPYLARMNIASLLTRLSLAAAVALSAMPARATPATVEAVPVEADEAAAARDAAEYARVFGGTIDHARASLAAQVGSVPATDAIAREFAGRLVGIAFDQEPSPVISVLLTGDAPVAARTIVAGDVSIPVLFRTGAAASESELVAAITTHQATIRASLTKPPGMGIDPRTGEVVILISAADAREGVHRLQQSLAAEMGVPVRVELSSSSSNTMIAGGSRVVGSFTGGGTRYACTTGFAVSDGTRTGVLTAAHCPDQLSYVGVDHVAAALDYVGQWGWGYQDVQINTSPLPLAPYFFADTAKTMIRPVARIGSRASTRAGDLVCHRGERTGYSCARVLMTDFAPAGDLCGGACLPTWVAVAGPTCLAGDSGAPVFTGTTALGIVKGGTYRADGSCTMYFYMSLDYVPTGWQVMTPDAPAMIAPLPLPPYPSAR
jgi:streptogrisin C